MGAGLLQRRTGLNERPEPVFGYRHEQRNSLAWLQSGFLDEEMAGAGKGGRRGLGSWAGQACALLSEDGICGSVWSLLSEPSKQQEPLGALEVFFEKSSQSPDMKKGSKHRLREGCRGVALVIISHRLGKGVHFAQ